MKDIYRISKTRLGLFALLSAVLAGFGLLQHSSAAAGQMYISPGSTSIQSGSTATFQIRVHPSTPADSVSATINYDKSKLQFVSVSGAGSPFTFEVVNSGGNGVVDVQRVLPGSTVSTDVLVATVKFKALIGGGANAALDLSGYTVTEGVQHSLSVIDGSVTLTSPSSGTPSTGGGGSSIPSSGGSSGSSSSGSGSSSDGESSSGNSASSGSDGGGSSSGNSGQESNNNQSKPQVAIKRREFRKLAFTISSKNKSSVYIKFGTDREQLNVVTQKTKLGTSHDVSLPDSLLIPGTTFFYKVVAEDESGNKTESEILSVKTKGYTVRILVLDKFDRRIRNSKVILHSEPMEATTDENGYAVFTDVAPGRHELVYEQEGQEFRTQVDIQEDRITTAPDGTQTANEQQTVAIFSSVEFLESKPALILYVAIAAIVLLAIAGGYIVLRRRNVLPLGGLRPVRATFTKSQSQEMSQDSDKPIDKAQGVNRPDPGSVVSPHHDDKEK